MIMMMIIIHNNPWGDYQKWLQIACKSVKKRKEERFVLSESEKRSFQERNAYLAAQAWLIAAYCI